MDLKEFLRSATVIAPNPDPADSFMDLNEFWPLAGRVAEWPDERDWDGEAGVLGGLACRYQIGGDEDDDPATEDLVFIDDELLYCFGLTDEHFFWLAHNGSSFGLMVLTVARRADGAVVGHWSSPDGSGWVDRAEWYPPTSPAPVEYVPDHAALVDRLSSVAARG